MANDTLAHEQISVVIDGGSIVEAYTKRRLPRDCSNSPPTGTDSFSGYAFHRKLEIYNESGIPASEVLRIATIEAATVMLLSIVTYARPI